MEQKVKVKGSLSLSIDIDKIEKQVPFSYAEIIQFIHRTFSYILMPHGRMHREESNGVEVSKFHFEEGDMIFTEINLKFDPDHLGLLIFCNHRDCEYMDESEIIDSPEFENHIILHLQRRKISLLSEPEKMQIWEIYSEDLFSEFEKLNQIPSPSPREEKGEDRIPPGVRLSQFLFWQYLEIVTKWLRIDGRRIFYLDGKRMDGGIDPIKINEMILAYTRLTSLIEIEDYLIYLAVNNSQLYSFNSEIAIELVYNCIMKDTKILPLHIIFHDQFLPLYDLILEKTKIHQNETRHQLIQNRGHKSIQIKRQNLNLFL